MGLTAPRAPMLPPRPHCRLDLTHPDHREAYSRFEAEREYDCWLVGSDYAPTPPTDLWFYDGRISPGPPCGFGNLPRSPVR